MKGDIVIIKEDDVRRNQWPMARIEEVFTDDEGMVRSVKIRTSATGEQKKGSLLIRPITKLVLLLEVEDPPDSSEGGE